MDFMVGRYSIDDHFAFWRVYTRHRGSACLLELSGGPDAYSPVRADIDIILGAEPRQDADVLKTIRIYRDVLSEIAPKATGKALTCLLLDKRIQKPQLQDQKPGKHGFHLQFPFLALRNADQSRVLTSMVRERVKHAGLFFKCKYDVDDIAMKPWLIYGSAKSRDAKPYRVTRVFDHSGKEIKLTAVTRSKYPHTCALPKLLSVHSKTATRYEVSPKFLIPPKPKRPRPALPVDPYDTYNTIRGLLRRLNPERRSRYSDWISVGKSIYGETDGDGFELWDDWSRGAHNYKSDEMCWKWRSFSCTEASIGTLRWMARQDDPTPVRAPTPTLLKPAPTQAAPAHRRLLPKQDV
jgi:hypothetical protein